MRVGGKEGRKEGRTDGATARRRPCKKKEGGCYPCLEACVWKACLRDAELSLQGPDATRIFLHPLGVILNLCDLVCLPGLSEGSPSLSGCVGAHFDLP